MITLPILVRKAKDGDGWIVNCPHHGEIRVASFAGALAEARACFALHGIQFR